MGILHILHGLPGTGKSTFAETLRKRGKTIILNNDEWMVRLHGTNPPAKEFPRFREEIEGIQWDLACKLLKEGIDVVWDYGVWTRAERLKIRSRAETSGIEHRFYRMSCDCDTALRRVLQRTREGGEDVLEIDEPSMEYFMGLFEEVSESEGFEIIEVDTHPKN